MNKKDRSLDLSMFLKKNNKEDRSLDLSIFDKKPKQQYKGGAKKKSQSKSEYNINIEHKNDEQKLEYKRNWYKKNAKNGKNVKNYNKEYYEKHKKELKIKREKDKKKSTIKK